jgi:hypothetical protein
MSPARSIEHRTATLDDSISFQEWAREKYPAPRWSVQPDPRQLGRELWPR